MIFSLLQRFATFVQRQSSYPFLTLLFDKYQSLATIDVYELGIAATIKAFKV